MASLSDFLHDCLTRIGAKGITESQEGFEAFCPYCEERQRKRTFRVAIRSTNRKHYGRLGAWVCLRADCQAGHGGYIESLVMRAYRCDFAKALEILEKRKLKVIVRKAEGPKQEEEISGAQIYPYIGQPCSYLLKERQLRQEDLDFYSIGYDQKKDQVLIPTLDTSGKIVGLTTRPAYNGGRYMHSQFQKSSHLFGLYQVLKANPGLKKLALCEGQLDPVGARPHFEIPAVAQMGAALSEEQGRLIKQTGIEELYLMMDNDEAGRWATWKAIVTMRELKFGAIYVVCYDVKDPGVLTRDRGKIIELQRSSRWIAKFGNKHQ